MNKKISEEMTKHIENLFKDAKEQSKGEQIVQMPLTLTINFINGTPHLDQLSQHLFTILKQMDETEPFKPTPKDYDQIPEKYRQTVNGKQSIKVGFAFNLFSMVYEQKLKALYQGYMNAMAGLPQTDPGNAYQ